MKGKTINRKTVTITSMVNLARRIVTALNQEGVVYRIKVDKEREKDGVGNYAAIENHVKKLLTYITPSPIDYIKISKEKNNESVAVILDISSGTGDFSYSSPRGKNRLVQNLELDDTFDLTHIKKLNKDNKGIDTLYVGERQFQNGTNVPIFEVSSVHAMNRLIGYAKYINRDECDILYRGEEEDYPSLLPSLYRGKSKTYNSNLTLVKLMRKIQEDKYLQKSLNLDSKISQRNECLIEGVLQHYGVKTRYVDVVDNHWVALWMGQYKRICNKGVNTYYTFNQREFSLMDYISTEKVEPKDLYQYILLIAVPHKRSYIGDGISVSKDCIVVDLRQALPSTFLRPHAQHGLLIRKRPGEQTDDVNLHDLTSNVVGILKIRIDRVRQWLGDGELLTQANLFPAPAFDHGYANLINRKDIFDKPETSIDIYY